MTFDDLPHQVETAILEARATVGGVWRAFGNPHSRVNSTEPAYRMQVPSGIGTPFEGPLMASLMALASDGL